MRFLKKILRILKSHLFVIVGASALALLVGLPIILLPFFAKDQYRGINIAHPSGSTIDALTYLSEGKEILEGHSKANIALREGKNGQPLAFSDVEYVIVAPMRWLGLAEKIEIVTLYDVYSFVYVVLIVILIYSFLLQLSGSRRFSAVAALLVVGGYTIIDSKAFGSAYPNMYLRATQPAINIIALFIYLNLILKFIKTEEGGRRLYITLSTLMFGILFYMGFFVWTFAFILTGSLLVAYLLKKDFRIVRGCLLILLGGVLIGAYQLYKMFVFFSSEAGRQTSFLLSGELSRAPILFRRFSWLVTLIFIIYTVRNKRDKNLFLIFGIILAGWISLNQQVITGMLVHPDHYYQYFIIPLFIALGFYMVWFMVGEKMRKIMVIAALLALYLNTAVGQYAHTQETLPRRLYEQNYRPIIDFLNQDKISRVILTAENDFNGLLFNVYTPHDLFWHYEALPMSNPHLWERVNDALCVGWYLEATDNQKIEKEMEGPGGGTKEISWFSHHLQGTYEAYEAISMGYKDYSTYRRAAHDAVFLEKRHALIQRLVSQCQEIVKDDAGLMRLLAKYDVKYMVWDKNTNRDWRRLAIKGLKEVFSFNNIYVYQIEQ